MGLPGEASVLQTATSLKDIEEIFDDDSLSDLFGPSYMPNMTPVNATLDLRGLDATLEDTSGSDILIFRVPAAGINVMFDAPGIDREASEEQFEDWLRGERVPGVPNLVTDFLNVSILLSLHHAEIVDRGS